LTSKYKQINLEGGKLVGKEESIKPIRIPLLDSDELAELEEM
jgi:hypothetical protein